MTILLFFVLFCLFVCLFFSAQLSAFRLDMFMSTKHLNDDSFYKFAKHPKATPAGILSINLSNCLMVEKLVFKPRKLEILLRLQK